MNENGETTPVLQLDELHTTATFDSILRDMYAPEPAEIYDEPEMDPSWYSTD